MIIKAQYAKEPLNNEVCSIIVAYDDGRIYAVPLDPANTDYANIMALVAAGELTIAPADGAE
jgi:hypothetical protein